MKVALGESAHNISSISASSEEAMTMTEQKPGSGERTDLRSRDCRVGSSK